jgi:hypothetical protein
VAVDPHPVDRADAEVKWVTPEQPDGRGFGKTARPTEEAPPPGWTRHPNNRQFF